MCQAKISTSNAKGPLGPKWQPLYDGLYSTMMMTMNLPHLAFFSFSAIAIAALQGHLDVKPYMPLVSVFIMARVPFVGCCMSMCLHRYFAHAAFKTTRWIQFLLAIQASMALQGGCLWWASKHLRHHKHCDQPLDPHSPTQTSNMYAWLGWMYYETHHDWAFVPQRFCKPEILLVNILFPFPNIIATFLLSKVVGNEWALFLCWVPAVFGALATTHFNVEYHPIVPKEGAVCSTLNKENGDKGIGPLRLEWLAKTMPFLFEPLVGEAFHLDHHDYPRRAQRPGIDVPYLFVLRPLAKLGLIWDLQDDLISKPPKMATAKALATVSQGLVHPAQ